LFGKLMTETVTELAPWRSPLARALHRNRSLIYARYLQLATVRLDGRPANRTVVFRGFRPEGDRLVLISDDRSQKQAELRVQPWAEICWYFPKSREQFRMLGQVEVVDRLSADQGTRIQIWQGLSDNARSQFAWPDPRADRANSDAFSPQEIDEKQPLDSFSVLLLDPAEVDHLELRGEPQNRSLYRLEETGWELRSVNP
jgi:pyridoxamine 5'-phosphate oxidase